MAVSSCGGATCAPGGSSGGGGGGGSDGDSSEIIYCIVSWYLFLFSECMVLMHFM